MHFEGFLYRALNPIYASDPLSGEGAKRYGGRFNMRGTAALYTALLPETAIRESHQAGTLQPIMLLCYEAEILNVFDTSNERFLKSYGISEDNLAADNWREQMIINGQATTQQFAQRLIDDGYAGMSVRSYAPGASRRDRNIVLWSWSDKVPTKLKVVDEENRITKAFGVND